MAGIRLSATGEELSQCVAFALTTFESLSTASDLEAGVLLAEEWAPRPGTFFGVGQDLTRYLLFSIEPGLAQSEIRRIGGLIVEAGVAYKLQRSNGDRENGLFVTVGLASNEMQYSESFAGLCALLVQSLPTGSSSAEIRAAIDSLAGMFASRRTASRSEVLGLWGELQCLTWSPDLDRAVDAWHLRWSDKFDFGFGGQYLEVKTTEGTKRIHVFGLDQLRNGNSTIYVASVLAVADPNGASVLSLLSSLLEKLSSDRKLRVSEIVAHALGSDIEAASDYRWSLGSAGSIAVIEAKLVPVPLVQPADPIADVSFRVDLTGLLSSGPVLLLKDAFP